MELTSVTALRDRLGERLGERQNTSAVDGASWLLAIALLTIVIPANDKIASNAVFFAAHAVSPVAWAVVLVVVLALLWSVLTLVFWSARRFLRPAGYDAVASVLTFALAWFVIANAVVVTILADAPWLGAVVGLVAAIGLTLVARRLTMGKVLVLFAAVATAFPLVATLWSGSQVVESPAYALAANAERPNVVWVVADELTYAAAFAPDGTVRPGLPNLRDLAAHSTTYTNAYAPANFTDYAVPAMLNGQADLSAMDQERIQRMRSSLGIVARLAEAYAVVVESPMYSYDCDDARCASVGVGAGQSLLERYALFAADTAAIVGRTVLASPFADAFPAVDGRWSDFWAGGEEFGNDPDGDTVDEVLLGVDQVRRANPGAPFLALWHTIRTHAPWVLDRDGEQIYPARVPVVEGAHMIGEEADERYTSEPLKALERRLWSASVQDFDRQLGELVDRLKASGVYDDTVIVVTADHGAAMTDHADRRVGDDQEQRWSQIAHVPLVVKAPGQSSADVVTEVRSTAQIAASILVDIGAPPDPDLAPGLAESVAGGPVFTDVKNAAMTRWDLPAGFVPDDPWRPEDFVPPDPRYPFAVGVGPGVLGAAAPSGFAPVDGVRVQTLPGQSEQQVLIVDRPTKACDVDAQIGFVTDRGTVVGSVLWEGPSGSADGGATTRGWAIVPRAPSLDDYAFSCTLD